MTTTESLQWIINRLERGGKAATSDALSQARHALAQETARAAIPDMIEALERAAELIKIARQYFPKSINKSDTFFLENTCAAINTALHKAKGEN